MRPQDMPALVDILTYIMTCVIIRLTSVIPIKCLAWAGHQIGGLAWHIDRRHRSVAIINIEAAFPELSPDDCLTLAKKNFQRLGETYACILKTGGMNAEQIKKVLTIEGYERIEEIMINDPNANIILAIGHYGNFELFSWISLGAPSAQIATTYRALRQPKLNKLLLQLRAASGCLYFERRSEGAQLKETMKRSHIMLGLLADQSGGEGGLWLPVFGRETSVSPAPAVFAQRYQCRLFPSACFRVSAGHWKIELGEEILVKENGQRRSTEAITRDIIKAQEKTIRRDPVNWFWVHNRWKPRQAKTQ
jgi:KDO2-lipid IV(A) lauroyltransferase